MTGIVTSNKMTNAVVVTVYSTKLHPKYKKRFKTRKKYSAYCTDSKSLNIGQTVELVPCRPVSKTIRFKVKED